MQLKILIIIFVSLALTANLLEEKDKSIKMQELREKLEYLEMDKVFKVRPNVEREIESVNQEIQSLQ